MLDNAFVSIDRHPSVLGWFKDGPPASKVEIPRKFVRHSPNGAIMSPTFIQGSRRWRNSGTCTVTRSGGLVEKPEGWPWSSFAHDATGTTGTVKIEPEWTARKQKSNKILVSGPR